MAFSAKDNKNKKNAKPSKEYREELLAIDRVTRVALWTGKSWEVVDAIAKAVANAKKKLVDVKIVNWTVPYNVENKYKSAKIMIHPASEGTGIIAGGAVRKVLAAAGYSNVLAKRYGSTNLINNARAAIEALSSFK